MKRSVDIGVVGGGAIGSSIAAHPMKSEATPRVFVPEADPA
jgi:hypothetical protein